MAGMTQEPLTEVAAVAEPTRSLQDRAGHYDPLEQQVSELVEELQRGEQELAVLRRDAANRRSGREAAEQGLPLAQRSKRLAAERQKEVGERLRNEHEAREKLLKDTQGLRRTVERLEQRRQDAEAVAELEKADEEESNAAKQTLDIEEESLRLSLASMVEMEPMLERRVAAEREQRLRLKAAVRSKFQRIGDKHEDLLRQLGEHEIAMEQWRQKIQEQEARAASLTAVLHRSRVEHRRARHQRQNDKSDKDWLRHELNDATRKHDQLLQELESTRLQIAEWKRRQADVQKEQCLRRIAKVDARTNARRAWLDQKIAGCHPVSQIPNARAKS